jgi:hypothetical protein
MVITTGSTGLAFAASFAFAIDAVARTRFGRAGARGFSILKHVDAGMTAGQFVTKATCALFLWPKELLDTELNRKALAYRHVIHSTFLEKSGLQSPFVHWRLLTQSLLEDALLCIPPAHLKLWFVRLARDIRANRTGFPDLIRFWPAQRRYEMVEVKGPGDRLQDNQIRWLAYCAEHGMPVRVVHVRWAHEADEAAVTA